MKLRTRKRSSTSSMPPMWSAWAWVATRRSMCRTPRRRSSGTTEDARPASTSAVFPPGAWISTASPCPTSKKVTRNSWDDLVASQSAAHATTATTIATAATLRRPSSGGGCSSGAEAERHAHLALDLSRGTGAPADDPSPYRRRPRFAMLRRARTPRSARGRNAAEAGRRPQARRRVAQRRFHSRGHSQQGPVRTIATHQLQACRHPLGDRGRPGG